jgi:hypothetical protein
MKNNLVFSLCVLVFFCFSCGSEKAKVHSLPSPEEQAKQNVESIKELAQDGDLLVRLGDDILSYQIKFLNEKDQSFSHAGIVFEKDNQKLVAHIAPDDSTKDNIQFIAIDSFLDTEKNLLGALYRYNLSTEEKALVHKSIESYHNANVHFDWHYDMATTNRMYCSEMISKAVTQATNQRIQFRQVNVPPKMQPLLVKYFKGQLSKDTIATRKIMTIDNLYLKPECKKIVQVTLKSLPTQQ